MNYNTDFLDNEAAFDHGVATVWEFARLRIRAGLQSRAIRLEIGGVALALALLFALPLLTWWRHWAQPNSAQNYALWILPLIAGWLWVNRLRVVLPELDELNERFTERSVLRFLVEEEPEPPKRLRWPLGFAVALTLLALRLGDPTFTGAAFALLLVGIVGYRLGTTALRVLFFPLCLLVLMIPAPGFFLDGINKRADVILMKITLHLMQIAGYNAEMGQDSNPMQLYGPPGKALQLLYSGYIGNGVAEAGLFLLLTLCLLSLYEAPFRAKFLAFALGGVWVTLLVIARVFLLAALIHPLDEDVYAVLIPLTRWAIPVLGLAGQMLILRGLKCRKFHEWVAFSSG